MKPVEVVKLLEDGKKVRRKAWHDGKYMFLDENYNVVLQNGEKYIGFNTDLFDCLDWEEYKEESTFSIGDWVIGKHENIIGQIAKINKRYISEFNEVFAYFNNKQPLTWIHAKDLRLATEDEIKEEKQRRFWNELDRKINEYKFGDIIKGKGWDTDLWRMGTFKKYVDNNVVQIEEISDGSTYDVKIETVILMCPIENRIDLD